MATEAGMSADIVRDPMTEQAEMRINMGPQHPATHGVFRMVLTLDGERVVDVYPHIGYLHRGSERLAEGENFQQITTLFRSARLRCKFQQRMGVRAGGGKGAGS